MVLEIFNEEKSYNRASRKTEVKRYKAGAQELPDAVMLGMRKAAAQYRMNMVQVAAMALSYYFGDGADHLSCTHCLYFDGDGCGVPEVGEQTTAPYLTRGGGRWATNGLPGVMQNA